MKPSFETATLYTINFFLEHLHVVVILGYVRWVGGLSFSIFNVSKERTKYLVTSDTTLSGDGISTIYQKRWNVECYHKSLKQNASLEKSPTQTVTTQTNHFFAALCGYVKLELLKGTTKLKHFALKSKLYLQAIQSAYATLRELNPVSLTA